MGGWCENPEGVLEEAVANARRGIELEPMDGEAHNALSMALMMKGRQLWRAGRVAPRVAAQPEPADRPDTRRVSPADRWSSTGRIDRSGTARHAAQSPRSVRVVLLRRSLQLILQCR